MFLKKIYISGFKSFAKPIQIQFTDDINAIVGPNGSGKSNISDAIRFVLGEQRTSQMRSQKMEDIIFSGTEAERARGAAEVRLVLDRGEESDLIVSRKLYRTGESRYLLNGKRVRLKDIQKIFYDTGLGKNGYSIVSQGGVDKIIGSNPTTIRELVEEAVGIAGYKAKRVETQRHLEATQDNIDRVEDILSEIERQIGPLKNKAQKARRYLEINKILRSIDLVSFYSETCSIKEKLTELGKDIDDVNAIIKDLETRSARADKEYLLSKKRAQATQREEELAEAILEELKSHLIQIGEEKIKEETLLERERVESIERKKDFDALDKRIENLYAKLDTYTNEVRENSQLNLEETEKNKLLHEKIFENEKVLEKQQILRREEEQKLHQYYQDTKDLNAQLLDLRTRDSELEIKMKSFDTYLEEIQEIEENLSKRRGTFKDKKRQLTEIDETIQKLKESRINLENKSDVLFSECERERAGKSALLDKINYQKRLLESHSGYSRAVRAILDFAQNRSNVYGVVGENFSVKKEHALAIHTVLGNRAQNIIVEDQKTAQYLINYLKKKQIGRATFLPLNALKYKPLSDSLYKEMAEYEGFIGTASELIETEEILKPAFESLLSRSIVVDGFKNAAALSRKYNFTIVTLTGEIFYPGGAIVGGKTGRESKSVFSPNLEIERLENELREINSRIDLDSTRFSHTKENLQSVERELELNQEKRLKCSTQIEMLRTEIEALINRKESLNTELDSFENTNAERIRVKEKISKAEENLEKKRFEKTVDEQKEESIQKELNNLRTDLNRSDLILNTLQQKRENLDESMTRNP